MDRVPVRRDMVAGKQVAGKQTAAQVGAARMAAQRAGRQWVVPAEMAAALAETATSSAETAVELAGQLAVWQTVRLAVDSLTVEQLQQQPVRQRNQIPVAAALRR